MGVLSGIVEGGDPSPVNATTVAAAGAVMSGSAAGGDLSGTYPNPSVVDDSHAHTAATLPVSYPVTSRLAADLTLSTATMAATGLSVPVVSGRKYVFEIAIMATDASSANGMKFDFDASTATASLFRCYPDDGSAGFFSVSTTGYSTALATDISGTGFVDESLVIRGTIEVSGSGTLALRAAQLAHVSGNTTIFKGSYMVLMETAA